MKRLDQKICLITGAAKGIGQAIAELFHQEGGIVLISDIDDKVGQALSKSLPQSEYHHLDVKHETEWQKITQYILDKYGQLDVLVNNAGITGFLETSGPFDAEHMDLTSWESVQAVNSTGVMLGCKYGIKMMKTNGGNIVNISSRSGIVGIPLAVAYAGCIILCRERLSHPLQQHSSCRYYDPNVGYHARYRGNAHENDKRCRSRHTNGEIRRTN